MDIANENHIMLCAPNAGENFPDADYKRLLHINDLIKIAFGLDGECEKVIDTSLASCSISRMGPMLQYVMSGNPVICSLSIYLTLLTYYD